MMNSKKKVLFILGSLKRGGAERVVTILAEEFYKIGFDVNIAVLLFNDIDYPLNKNIHVADLTVDGSSRVKKIPVWLRKIRGLVKEWNPDCVISFAARINILTQIACIGLKKDIVVSERNDPRHDGRGMITRIAVEILYPKAKKVVFQTNRVKQYFRKKICENSIIIFNPISVSILAKKVKEKKIVSAGRLSKQKNQELLIEAFSKISCRYPTYSLWIYGEGELRQQLVKQADSLGIRDKIHFPGNVPDIHEKISDAELFVLSSDYEGLSNALLEAMMMGLPCISTDCAGSDEVIEDGVNGLLVPTGDVEALCEAMDRLITDEELRCRIAENARKISEKFSVEKVIGEWRKVIE